MRWSQSPQSSTHGLLVRSLSIAGTTPPVSIMAVLPHWSLIPPLTDFTYPRPYGRWQQPEPALSGYNVQNGYRPIEDQTHQNHLQRCHPRCRGLLHGLNHNFRSEELIFDIVPFRSGYHALLGRTAFARFNAVPHYAYLKHQMHGPRGVITVNGNIERSLLMEEHSAALTAEVQSSLLRQTANSAIKPPDTFKRVRSTLQ